jgi:uncharacterized integral membrane protein
VTVWRLVPMLAVTLFAAAFVALNRGETVVVNLGVVRFYQAPLTVVAFLSFLVGMLAMLALSLRHDLHVRRTLRDRGLLEGSVERTRPRVRTDTLPDSPAFDVPATGSDEFSR